jgi:Galactose oxidase-like, Early set domain/Bacterial Ig domain
VFSPPYLFAADGSPAVRPVIAGAPGSVNAGGTFRVDTPDAAVIAKVALVRLGAVTHSVNMEQRYVPLAFTRGSGSLTATAPANLSITPPGAYMLFLVDAAGVPSIARMVTVADAVPPPPPPANTPPAVSITQPLDGTVLPFKPTIAVTAAASDTAPGTVARVEFVRNGTLVATDTGAPYSWTWKNAPQGTSTLTARATDNQGAQTTSAPVRVTVNKR